MGNGFDTSQQVGSVEIFGTQPAVSCVLFFLLNILFESGQTSAISAKKNHEGIGVGVPFVFRGRFWPRTQDIELHHLVLHQWYCAMESPPAPTYPKNHCWCCTRYPELESLQETLIGVLCPQGECSEDILSTRDPHPLFLHALGMCCKDPPAFINDCFMR